MGLKFLVVSFSKTFTAEPLEVVPSFSAQHRWYGKEKTLPQNAHQNPGMHTLGGASEQVIPWIQGHPKYLQQALGLGIDQHSPISSVRLRLFSQNKPTQNRISTRFQAFETLHFQ